LIKKIFHIRVQLIVVIATSESSNQGSDVFFIQSLPCNQTHKIPLMQFRLLPLSQ